MDKQKLLEELGKTPYGEALRTFLHEELKEISDVDNATNEAELIGAQKAKKVINKLFSFLNPQEKTKKKRTSYR